MSTLTFVVGRGRIIGERKNAPRTTLAFTPNGGWIKYPLTRSEESINNANCQAAER